MVEEELRDRIIGCIIADDETVVVRFRLPELVAECREWQKVPGVQEDWKDPLHHFEQLIREESPIHAFGVTSLMPCFCIEWAFDSALGSGDHCTICCESAEEAIEEIEAWSYIAERRPGERWPPDGVVRGVVLAYERRYAEARQAIVEAAKPWVERRV